MKSRAILVLVLVVSLGGLWWLEGHGRRRLRTPATGERSEVPAETPVATLEGAEVAPEPSRERAAQREKAVAAPSPRPAGGKAWIEVRVVARETGLPIPDVQVLLVAHESWHAVSVNVPATHEMESRSARAEAHGRVRLEAKAGVEHTLRVDAFDRVHARAEAFEVSALEAGEQRELEIELVTSDDLRWFGRVLDDATGEPLAGASVEWVTGGPFRGRAPLASAADGMLVLDFASWQEARIQVEVPGYRAARVQLERGRESPELALPIRLVRPAALEVRVSDGLGNPRSSVAVEVDAPAEAPALSQPSPSQGRRSTDPDGMCSFDDLPPRVALSVAVRPGIGLAQRRSVILAPGETRVLDVRIASGCSVRGVALDERGEPLAGLDLWRLACGNLPPYLETQLESAVVDKVRTDGEGRFAFESVPPGEWWIGPAPYHRTIGIVPLAARVSIPPEESVHLLTLVCRSAHYIRGRVLGAHGLPAKVSVRAEQEGVHVLAESGGDGRFALGPLPSGAWQVQARDQHTSATSEVVSAEAGEEDVTLRLQAGGLLIGVVRDARGSPVVGAEVTLAPEGSGSWRTAFSDGWGLFHFESLSACTYHVRASFGALAGVLGPLVVEPRSEQTDLEIVLELGAELRLRLARNTADRLEVRVRGNGVPLFHGELAPGTEEVVTLLSGLAVVQLLRRSEAQELVLVQEESVELRAGETTVVELDGDVGPAAQR